MQYKNYTDLLVQRIRISTADGSKGTLDGLAKYNK